MGTGDGITVYLIPPANAGALRFEVHGMIDPTPSQAAAIDSLWNDLRQSNPRLYDGPVLLVDREAMLAQRLLCFRGTYRHLAVSAHSTTKELGGSGIPPFRGLGVQGLVIGKDADGDELVLMGRRSTETRIYGGLWENAPSGTVPAPRETETFIDWPHFTTALRNEGLEELGLNLDTSSVQWIALVEDQRAGSIDVVLRFDMGKVDARRLPCPIHEGRWEYVDSAWVQTKGLRDWITRGAAVSTPTLGLFKHLGWV